VIVIVINTWLVIDLVHCNISCTWVSYILKAMFSGVGIEMPESKSGYPFDPPYFLQAVFETQNPKMDFCCTPPYSTQSNLRGHNLEMDIRTPYPPHFPQTKQKPIS
jgi:hypothetical protein